MLAKNWKFILVAALLLAAAWVAKRSLTAPPTTMVARVQPPTTAENGNASRGKQGKRGDAANLADVDPTLRLDLLDAARSVEYRGASRNIFEVYTPPPPPAPPPPPTPPPVAPQPVTPPPPSIPLKFYGFAQPAGSNIKQVFLTNGDEIIIANEGDVVARYYKVGRIGVSSLELEDTRTKTAQTIPLAQDEK